MQNHDKNLWLVLQRLREKMLAVSANKANMFVEQVEFDGHRVCYGVKRPISWKITCLEKWDKPRTVSELRVLLNLANHHQEFVCLYAHHEAPLTPCSNSPS